MKNIIDFKTKKILIAFCLLFLFLFPLFCFPQKPKEIKNFPVWQQRVERLRDEIVQDSSTLPETEQAVHLALLAQMWQKINPQEAKVFLKKASILTISSLESDDKISFEIKVKNTQKTIQIIAGLDEVLSQTLINQLVKITDQSKTSQANPDTLVLIALQIVEKNPQSAYQLGVKSLNLGIPLQIVRLIGELMVKKPELAEQLFLASLMRAQKSYDLRFISRLSVTAFSSYHEKILSDSVRRAYLTMLTGMVSQAALDERERQSGCEIIIVASPIIDKFDLYLPQQSQTIRQQISICQPYLPKSNQGLSQADTQENKPQTVDELIQAARDTDDKFLKPKYFYQAINKLEQEKKFDQIVSLLDDMTESERASLGSNTWESWRENNAFSLALQFIENNDLPSVYKVIDNTPKTLRPYIRTGLAGKLELDRFHSFILENLEETRKEINSIEMSAAEKAGYFLLLTRLYVKLQPSESESVFRETIKNINIADSENSENKPEKDYAPLRDFISLPSKLLENNDVSIFNTLADISSRNSHLRLKLGLLESCLPQYIQEKKKNEPVSKPTKQ